MVRASGKARTNPEELLQVNRHLAMRFDVGGDEIEEQEFMLNILEERE